MAGFRVWAPKATKAAVETARGRFSMTEKPGGWYEAEVTSAHDGDDYWFVLDDGERLPDPRTQSQPSGIAGPSRLLDHAAFQWRHDTWTVTAFDRAVVYELHVGTFSQDGTFDGVIEHLDHLVNLGITHVELMPVNEFSGSYGWGYDSVDIYAPHHAYGGPAALKRLIDGCHERGLAVIADVVYNHFGPLGNYLERFGNYLTDRHTTPWGRAVNLDGPGSDDVRRYLCDHALTMLRDYRFDALRLDAVHAIFDMSAVHFLEQLATETRELEEQLGRKLLLIAESDLNDPRVVRAPAAGGYGIDAQWSDDFHHALHSVLTGEKGGYYQDFGSLADLAKALKHPYVLDGRYSAFRGRHHGRSPRGLPASKFVVFLQNHDQVGNRAKGERSGRLMDLAHLKIGAAIVLSGAYVPMLFQGEEWAASAPFLYFTDHQDQALAQSVRAGRRSEFAAFGWRPEEIPDPQARDTFIKSKLDWSEVDRSPHREILEWYRSLIRLRREVTALTQLSLEATEVEYDDAARWIAIRRGPISVLCNLGDRERTLPCGEGKVLLSSGKVVRQRGGLKMSVATVAVLLSES
ncbi:MAG: malto-oligosyltrehalose trehalohydrolase [Deltaproteobacteria bacterium]|jgi:maltooligosyltrehalose trehalohydrolase|nr:malto-oligosyltrehalose trehalohydrolase [Deltaproteobacteria bacterium]